MILIFCFQRKYLEWRSWLLLFSILLVVCWDRKNLSFRDYFLVIIYRRRVGWGCRDFLVYFGQVFKGCLGNVGLECFFYWWEYDVFWDESQNGEGIVGDEIFLVFFLGLICFEFCVGCLVWCL